MCLVTSGACLLRWEWSNWDEEMDDMVVKEATDKTKFLKVKKDRSPQRAMGELIVDRS